MLQSPQMGYVADLHIHSKYSGACSGALSIPNLTRWAKFKGIDLLGTGDALHPLWQLEMKSNLKEVGDGTYENGGVRFIISTEVSCIYSEYGKTRRIHLLILLPSIESAQALSNALNKRSAKLASDGRPILGMSAKQICEITFGIEKNAIIIPAHIWTPWFSLLGSNSGYDLLTDCFGEFSEKILAVETGLSSQPAMNWRIGQLDDKSIVSFSDLHSLPRLGREVTIIGGEISYLALTESLKNQNIIATIEFFPEEGKYHLSGHRGCEIVYGPEELKNKGKICPVCGKQLTIGVLQRVEELATRSEEDLKLENNGGVITSKAFPNRAPFRMLIQLEEIIAGSMGVAVKSLKVQQKYEEMVTNIDTELKILTKVPKEMIAMAAGEKIAEGIERVRQGKLTIEPGYDNTYGKVRIWNDEEEDQSSVRSEQINLF